MAGIAEVGAKEGKKPEKEQGEVTIYFGIFFDGTNNNRLQVLIGKMYRSKSALRKFKKWVNKHNVSPKNVYAARSFAKDAGLSDKEIEDLFPEANANEFSIDDATDIIENYQNQISVLDESISSGFAHDSSIVLRNGLQEELNKIKDFEDAKQQDYFGEGKWNEIDPKQYGKWNEAAKVNPKVKEYKQSTVFGNGLQQQVVQTNDYTNIALLETLYQAKPEMLPNEYAYRIYVTGSGTDRNITKGEDIIGLGFGQGSTGVVQKVIDAIACVENKLTHFNKVSDNNVSLIFHLFGFSRGAAEARIFAHVFNKQMGEVKIFAPDQNNRADGGQIDKTTSFNELTTNALERVMAHKGYAYFKDGDYNLNIIGIRSDQHDKVTNEFDDFMLVTYNVGGKPNVKVYPITTEPGLTPMTKKPKGKEKDWKGTAILAPGQYRGCWEIGLHKGQYKALKQINDITVYRDDNLNKVYDFNPSKKDTGIFGINIHRSFPDKIGETVGTWSEGCQVFASPKDFNEFMDLCEQQKSLHGNFFTYTLLEEKDFSILKGQDKAESLWKYVFVGRERIKSIIKEGNISIPAMGIYDTVSSVGVLYKKGFNKLAIFVESYIEPWSQTHHKNVEDLGLNDLGLVDDVYHICALDEYRENFALVPIDESTALKKTQIFIPGCHSDVGGGYPEGFDKKITFKENRFYMPKEVVPYHNRAGQNQPQYFLNEENAKGDVNKQNWFSFTNEELEKAGWLDKEKDLVDNIKDTVSIKRYSRKGYSYIGLRLMTDKFSSLFNLANDKFQIPPDLNENKIYDTIKGQVSENSDTCVKLDENSYRILRRDYLHLSMDNNKLPVNHPNIIVDNNSSYLSRIEYTKAYCDMIEDTINGKNKVHSDKQEIEKLHPSRIS